MRTFLLVLGVFLGAQAATADPGSGVLAVGDLLTSVRLVDQHDREMELGPGTRILLVTHEMDAGTVVREALADTPQTKLDELGIAYLANISAMPALVSKMFAIPKMKKRTYRVFLDRDGKLTQRFPKTSGEVAVVRLENLKVTALESLGNSESLRAALFPAQESPKP